MAKNRLYDIGSKPLPFVVAEGLHSGDPTVVGQIPMVLLLDAQTPATTACDTGGVYKLPVEGKNKAGNKKIEPGDIVYIKGGKIAVNNEEGVRFGYAMAEVASGATTTIPVKIGY